MKKRLIIAGIVIIVTALGLLIFQMLQPRIPAYILPTADYRGPETAPAALEGRITALGETTLTIKPKDGSAAVVVDIKEARVLLYDGGSPKLKNYVVDQYVWVWFVTRDSKQAGNPPRAAIVMQFSQDPNEQPK
jgi:hypothetical protein